MADSLLQRYKCPNLQWNIWVDEHARQNPSAQQQDDISQHADHARQPPGDLDPEGTAPSAAENGPLLGILRRDV